MFAPIASTRLAPVAAAAIAVTVGTLTGCASSGESETLLGDLFGSFQPPTPTQAALDAVNVYDPDKRREAIALLGAAPFGGEPEYLRLYRWHLGSSDGGPQLDEPRAIDPDPTVRAAAVRALGMHGTVEDAKLLVPRLEDDAAFVRWEAAKALQRVHNPIAISPLINVLRADPDTDVRMAAADALGQYATRAVFDALVGALGDSNYGVVRAARDSLRTLTGYDGGLDPSTWVHWAREQDERLFADQRPYRYQPYVRPPGLLERAQFWKSAETPPSKAPVGLEPVAQQEGS